MAERKAMTELELNRASDSQFMMQIPYINKEGTPRVIETTFGDARMLVRAKSHKAIKMDESCVLVTPIKAPIPGLFYRIHEPAV